MFMKTDDQIVHELKDASAGLMMMSESDYPFEIVQWKESTEPTDEHLRSVSGAESDAELERQRVDQFFRAAVQESDWKSEAELTLAKRFKRLIEVLKDNLHDLRVYRIGSRDIRVLIVGKSSQGTWLGLSTRVIET
jgi:hypothetical protein